MQTFREVPQQRVFDEWEKAGTFQPVVTAELPDGVRWSEARPDIQDINVTSIIRSDDWRRTFGTYDPLAIARMACLPNDENDHRGRICRMTETLLSGGTFTERPILVGPSATGPFTAIDGNHRVLAAIRAGRFVGLDVFLGIHPEMFCCGHMTSWGNWVQLPDGMFQSRFTRAPRFSPN